MSQANTPLHAALWRKRSDPSENKDFHPLLGEIRWNTGEMPGEQKGRKQYQPRGTVFSYKRSPAVRSASVDFSDSPFE